jgi:hypothetical protein
VIEGSVGPSNGVVAGRAIRGGEGRAGRGMHRIICLLPGGQVASGVAAIVGLNLQRVIIVDVARRAIGHLARGSKLVRIGERESRGAVIELSVSPRGDGVAGGASRSGGREIGSDVIGNVATESLRFVPVGGMAGQAVRAAEGVIVIDVAGNAGSRSGRHVRAGQSKAGGAVIERGGGPGNGAVASGAIGGGKGGAGGGVRWIVGLLPGGEVTPGIAAIVGLGGEIEIAAHVTIAAGSNFARRRELVRISERESRGAVIEFSIGPDSDGMARGAS